MNLRYDKSDNPAAQQTMEPHKLQKPQRAGKKRRMSMKISDFVTQPNRCPGIPDVTGGTPDRLVKDNTAPGNPATVISDVVPATSAPSGSVTESSPSVSEPVDGQMVVTMAEWCECLASADYGMRVYRKLMDLHVYPPIGDLLKQDPEMKEYAAQNIKGMEFRPFSEIYNALKDHFIEWKSEFGNNDNTSTFCLNTKSDNIPDTFLRLDFDPQIMETHVVVCEPERYNLGSPYHDAFQAFVTDVRDCIRELSITYSTCLFAEKNSYCSFEETVKDGKPIGYKSCEFGIYCDKILYAVIDFMHLLVSDKDTFYRWFAPERLRGNSYKG